MKEEIQTVKEVQRVNIIEVVALEKKKKEVLLVGVERGGKTSRYPEGSTLHL